MLGIEPSVSSSRTKRDTDSLHPVFTLSQSKVPLPGVEPGFKV